MGKRDYRHRETKKPKKDAKKLSSESIFHTPPPVEIIKNKGKKEPKEE